MGEQVTHAVDYVVFYFNECMYGCQENESIISFLRWCCDALMPVGNQRFASASGMWPLWSRLILVVLVALVERYISLCAAWRFVT